MKKEIEEKETQEIKERKERRKKTTKIIAKIGIGAGVLVSTIFLLKRRSRNNKNQEFIDLYNKMIDEDRRDYYSYSCFLRSFLN